VRSRSHKSPEPAASGDVTIHASLSLGDVLRPFVGRFVGATVYFVVLVTLAMVGYHSIEGWGWFESFYMSVTTVTSVGFMEINPLSTAGRTFTTVVIALGVTGLGIWWALITAMIVELDLGGALRRRRKMKQIENLNGHYVICGAGRVGRMVMGEMQRAGTPMVIIERSPQRAASLEEAEPDLLVLCADATKERVLSEARIQQAKGMAACLADDADNLLVCLTARDLAPGLATVARAYDEESMDKLRRAGADHVISPTLTGGIRMASTLLRPHVVSFLDSAIVGPDMDLRLEEAEIPGSSPLAGLSLQEAGIPRRTGLVVIALRRHGENESQIYNPGPETKLAEGDVMIVLGHEDQLNNLREYARAG
jgi:voltage-gated potassium channel